MEWLTKMMDALDYMERNMEDKLDIEKIARIACSSTFHFQRMFHMVTGMTVAEYMRKRRLTLAAQELAISPNIKVLDISLKYGYDSPEAFAKAFRKVHGISPTAARESGAKLKAFPRIAFQISLKGEKDMDYRIIEREEFSVTGKVITISTGEGENKNRIPEFWDESYRNGTCDKLISITDKKDILLGICLEVDHEKEEFDYMVAVEGSNKTNEDYLIIRQIPAATWAVFSSVGPMPGAIQNVWQRIFNEWFPATGYEHSGGPELEVYPPGNNMSDDYYCEVWIPILKK